MLERIEVCMAAGQGRSSWVPVPRLGAAFGLVQGGGCASLSTLFMALIKTVMGIWGPVSWGPVGNTPTPLMQAFVEDLDMDGDVEYSVSACFD